MAAPKRNVYELKVQTGENEGFIICTTKETFTNARKAQKAFRSETAKGWVELHKNGNRLLSFVNY